MRDEEAFVMFSFLVLTGFAVWGTLRHLNRRERFRTIQRAIESDSLDESTRRALVDALAEEARISQQFWRQAGIQGLRLLRQLFAIVGWLTFVISSVVLGGMLALGAHRFDLQAAIVAVGIGLAMVTLPLALREIEARRLARP